VSVYSGVDPRDFVLFAYGAAGPLFGSRLGRELGVEEVVVPPLAGTLSASGLAVSGVRLDLSHPLVQDLASSDPAELGSIYADLEARAAETLGGEPASVLRWIDGRYRGQTWETPSVPVPNGPLSANSLADVRANFDDAHQRLWGYSLPDYAVTAMMARITAFAETSVDGAGIKPADAGAGGDAQTVEAFVDGAAHDVQLLRREQLAPGATLTGPAVILEATTTIVLMPGDTAAIDESGAVRITWEDAHA
jgi:N-methylhydantoinase A